MKSTAFIGLFLMGMLWHSAQSCLECGDECKQLCGTKQFKACCFNYLKKRNLPPTGPDLKLDVSLDNPAIRRGLYLPLAALLARQHQMQMLMQQQQQQQQEQQNHISEQGPLQLMYDA